MEVAFLAFGYYYAFQKGLQALLEADWKQLFYELKQHTVSFIKFFIHPYQINNFKNS